MANKLAIRADLDPRGVQVGAAVVHRELNQISTAAETSNRRVGTAASLSGEKMARYGTVIGAATGQMQRLGVQSDVLAKGFAVLGDVTMGVIGPAGIVLIGLGAAASAVGYLIGKQKELKKATEDAMKALVDQAQAAPGGIAMIPGVREKAQEELNAALQRRLELIRQIGETERTMTENTRPAGLAAYLEQDPVGVSLRSEGTLRSARDEAARLHGELVRVQDDILRLQTALGVGVTSIPEVAARAGAAGGAAGGQMPYRIRQRGGQGGAGATYGAAGPGAELRRLNDDMLNATIKIIPDKGAEIVKAWRENVVDPMQQSLANGIYGAFQAGKRGVDELGSYMLDFFTNNILKALSEKIAMSLAGSLAGGGGFISSLFTGSFGGDKDLGGAKSMNLAWRRARG